MTLFTGGFSRIVTSAAAPIATGWSESCRAGFAPAEKPRLRTAHQKSYDTASPRKPVAFGNMVYAGSWLPRIFALLTLLHNASIEMLKRPDIVRIKLGEGIDLLGQGLDLCRARAGFVPLTCRQVFDRLKRAAGEKSLQRRRCRNACGVKPETVAQVEFLEWTGANHLPHMKFIGLRRTKIPARS
jgi:hypothetical protein